MHLTNMTINENYFEEIEITDDDININDDNPYIPSVNSTDYFVKMTKDYSHTILFPLWTDTDSLELSAKKISTPVKRLLDAYCIEYSDFILRDDSVPNEKETLKAYQCGDVKLFSTRNVSFDSKQPDGSINYNKYYSYSDMYLAVYVNYPHFTYKSVYLFIYNLMHIAKKINKLYYNLIPEITLTTPACPADDFDIFSSSDRKVVHLYDSDFLSVNLVKCGEKYIIPKYIPIIMDYFFGPTQKTKEFFDMQKKSINPFFKKY